VAQENGAAPIQMYLMGCPFIPTALMFLLGVDYFGGESRVAAVAVSTKDDKSEKVWGVSTEGRTIRTFRIASTAA